MMKCYGATRALLLTLAVVLFAALALTAQTPAAPAKDAVAAPAPAATTAASPEVKALLDKVMATYGGKEKLAQVKNVRVTADLLAKTPQGDMQMSGEVIIVPPDSESISMTMPMGQIHIVFSPAASFQAFGDNVQDLPPDVAAATLDEMSHNDFVVLQHIDDGSYSFAIIGEELVAGVNTKVLAITFKGKTFTWFIDPVSGHVLRDDDVTMDQSGPAKISTYSSEWKTFNGAETATHIVIWQNGEISRTMDVKNFELNVTIDPAIFKHP